MLVSLSLLQVHGQDQEYGHEQVDRARETSESIADKVKTNTSRQKRNIKTHKKHIRNKNHVKKGKRRNIKKRNNTKQQVDKKGGQAQQHDKHQ